MKALGLVFDDIIIFQMTIVLRFSLPLRDRGVEKILVSYCQNVIWVEIENLAKLCCAFRKLVFDFFKDAGAPKIRPAYFSFSYLIT